MTNYRIPFLSVITPPATEPLTLSEAKLYLRVDSSTEDALITSLIVTARIVAEQYLQRSLISQVRKITFNDYSFAVISLPFGPVQSVDSIKLIARDGTETSINSAYYTLTAGNEKVVLDSGLLGNKVEVTYTAGYGEEGEVPENIRQGMLIHIATLFENRGEGGGIPKGVEELYRPYRMIRGIL